MLATFSDVYIQNLPLLQEENNFLFTHLLSEIYQRFKKWKNTEFLRTRKKIQFFHEKNTKNKQNYIIQGFCENVHKLCSLQNEIVRQRKDAWLFDNIILAINSEESLSQPMMRQTTKNKLYIGIPTIQFNTFPQYNLIHTSK